jgi:tetratricopeptide (TPR) repeat protein
MQMKRFTTFLTALALGAAMSNAIAGVDEDVRKIQQDWEEIKYRAPKAEQEKAFESLAKSAAVVRDKYPDRAEPEIWLGIVTASQAGAKGGLGALSLAKSAKKSLDHAIELDPRALAGSAYTSLGTLYYQVPGWPIGFGDDKKALENLQKALELNPQGIDPNYFMGDYLFRKGDYDGAKKSLEAALAAKPRPDRPLADEGRRREIDDLMAKIKEKKG